MNTLRMKRIALALMLAVVALCASACGGTASSPNTNTPEAQKSSAASQSGASSAETDKVIDYFMQLAQVPRQSHHEEKISAFMHTWLTDKGFEATRDDAGNVVAEVPATSGNESMPCMALQGHMDMVCVAADGVSFDPQNDPIKVVNDGVTLTADGTSLGADNGIGVALIMYIVDPENSVEHGPLRIIFTVNEEDGSTGVAALDPACVTDAKYLINVDSEEFGVLTNSTAGYTSMDMTATPDTVAPTKDTAVKLSISGLAGGHSGMEINTGKINGIKAVAGILADMDSQGIAYELASFVGGTARNAIPASAEAVLVIDAANRETLQKLVDATAADYKDSFRTTDGDFTLALGDAEMPASVLSTSSKDSVVRFAVAGISGVQTMSQKVDGLVESSSNIGIVTANADEILFCTYPRSSEQILMDTMVLSTEMLADACGLKSEVLSEAPAWPINENSTLVPLIADLYKQQTDSDLSVIAIHAGLECGIFAAYNPNLDIASIGPDISNPHTPQETLQIDSVGQLLTLMKTILTQIK